MIHIILGTKAQLIKMAPVMKSLQDNNLQYQFIHTGQHKETMNEMYRDFGIKSPDRVLYDGEDITSVPQIFGWFIKLLWISIFQKDEIFGNSDHSIILVHGDTLSTLLGAMMGRFSGIKVGHVESGLRSFNYFQPFPEEITRILVFRLSHILFCPGDWAFKNMSKFKNKKIVNTISNTMFDTIQLSKQKSENNIINTPRGPYVLVSLHRYENIFNKRKLQRIVKLLEFIAENYLLLFVLHPPTQNQLQKYGFLNRLQENGNINCVNRMQHSEFLRVLERAEFVVTDGGSLQEETSFLGIPCLLFREATERQDGLNSNVVLSKFDQVEIDNFINSYKELKKDKKGFVGSPSSIIVQYIKQLNDTYVHVE